MDILKATPAGKPDVLDDKGLRRLAYLSMQPPSAVPAGVKHSVWSKGSPAGSCEAANAAGPFLIHPGDSLIHLMVNLADGACQGIVLVPDEAVKAI